MKKFIVVAAAVLTLISTTALAGTKHGGNPAEKTFQNNFKGALDVKWDQGKDFISASFVLGNSRVVAYFDPSGELLGTARNIMFNQLPLNIITEMNKSYESAFVYDILEYTSGSETFYTMIAETPTKVLKLRASASGNISVESKTKK